MVLLFQSFMHLFGHEVNILYIRIWSKQFENYCDTVSTQTRSYPKICVLFNDCIYLFEREYMRWGGSGGQEGR